MRDIRRAVSRLVGTRSPHLSPLVMIRDAGASNKVVGDATHDKLLLTEDDVAPPPIPIKMRVEEWMEVG